VDEVAMAIPESRIIKAIPINILCFLFIVIENLRDVGKYNKLDKDKIEMR